MKSTTQRVFIGWILLVVSIIAAAKASGSNHHYLLKRQPNAPNTRRALPKAMLAPNSIPPQYVPSNSPVKQNTSYDFTMYLQGGKLDALDAKMQQISISGKGNWLSEDDLMTYVAPSASNTAAVKTFLQQSGYSPNDYTFSKYGDSVYVKSTLAKTAKAFNASFESFVVDTKNTVHRTRKYVLPASIADAVIDVAPLTQFSYFSSQSIIRKDKVKLDANLSAQQNQINNDPRFKSSQVSPNTAGKQPASCQLTGVTQDCLKSYYNLKSYKPATPRAGSPPAIGVLGYINEWVSEADLTNFTSIYAPAAKNYKIPILLRNGAQNDESHPGGEAMLDVETVVGVTYPLKSVFIAEGDSTFQGEIFTVTFQDIAENFTIATRPKVLSISYGSNEAYFTVAQNQVMCTQAQKLTALGVSIVASSGDDGVSGNQNDHCPEFQVTYPTNCPYITSVGATQGFLPETMTDYRLAGFYSGAGSSKVFATPSWQKQVVTNYEKTIGPEGDYYKKNGRFSPDLSAQGSLYEIIIKGQVFYASGTSASTPLTASLFALINDKRSILGLGPIGWANPALYKANNLNDIALGGSYKCDGAPENGFPAEKGWDGSAGLGSPMFDFLSKAFGV